MKTIINFISLQFFLMQTGTWVAKFKSLTTLSLIAAVPVNIVDSFTDWVDLNMTYIGFVAYAIAADWVIGTYVHAFKKKDFSIKRNLQGLIVKIMMAFIVGVLFEGFQFIYTEDNFISQQLVLITRIIVFLYPAGSAFINCSIVTNGKFPPIGWIKKVDMFNKNLDIKEFKEGLDDDETK